jgi:hypothetical protein
VIPSPEDVARAELQESGAAWRLHLAGCAICQRAESFRGLYCDTGRRLYRAHMAAKRLARTLTGR